MQFKTRKSGRRMEKYFIEPTFTKDGIPTSFDTETQSYNGRVITAHAHIHDKIEILYCLEGALVAFLNGEEHHISAGDMAVINSNEIHQIIGDTDEVNRYLVFKIEPEMLSTSSQAVFEMKYILPFTISSADYPQIIRKQILDATELPDIFRLVDEENRQKAYGYELAIHGCACRIFLWILRYWHSLGLEISDDAIPANHIDMLKRAFSYVDTHYMENISASSTAERCNVSYSYFSRMFKKNMGRSFTDYLNQYRITKAERLLISTEKSVTEIALETGFSDAGYFIKVFKKQKGLSPRKFKKIYTQTA